MSSKQESEGLHANRRSSLRRPSLLENVMIGCFGGSAAMIDAEEDKHNKEANKRIEEQIQRDKQTLRNTHKLILLGDHHSGKGTIIKQMSILHTNGFTEYEKRQIIKDIKKNIMNAIMTITKEMKSLKPPVQLENADNQSRVDYIQEVAWNNDFDYPDQFYEHTEALWNDKGVLRAFQRSNEYELIDCAQYFLDRLHIVKMSDYSPSEEDILRCGNPLFRSSGIFETKFESGKESYHFLIYDRLQRHKWIRWLFDMTAIIFVTDCSSYDVVPYGDPIENRLKESLDLFRSIWNNRSLDTFSVILFLNKEDRLAQKVKAGQSKIQDYFPHFGDYEIPPDVVFKSGEDPDLVRVKYFIRDEFMKISADNCCKKHSCYPFFTSAVDTENIRRVFNDCQDIIKQEHLRRYTLL